MSRAADLYAKVSPKLANKPGARLATRAHARLVRATRGHIGRRFLGAEVIVLRTTGRRSGKSRETPVFFVRDAGAFVAVAANAGASRPPAWLLNLDATPEAEVFVRGMWKPVRARRASDAEVARLWPKLTAAYAGNDHYRTVTARELPVVVLEPR